MDICHLILSPFSARPTLVKKLSDKQQGMLARELAVTHIQTLKVVSCKSWDMIKKCRLRVYQRVKVRSHDGKS